MKKYLMIGFAAVAFAACSNHDFETYTPEQVVKADYDAKFISEFGQPNPSHNWGFGAEGTRAFTRTENANANAPPGAGRSGKSCPPAAPYSDKRIAGSSADPTCAFLPFPGFIPRICGGTKKCA